AATNIGIQPIEVISGVGGQIGVEPVFQSQTSRIVHVHLAVIHTAIVSGMLDLPNDAAEKPGKNPMADGPVKNTRSLIRRETVVRSVRAALVRGIAGIGEPRFRITFRSVSVSQAPHGVGSYISRSGGVIVEINILRAGTNGSGEIRIEFVVETGVA